MAIKIVWINRLCELSILAIRIRRFRIDKVAVKYECYFKKKITVGHDTMNFLFENPLKMFRLLYVLNLIGTRILYVTSALKTAFKFISSQSANCTKAAKCKSGEIDATLCEQFSASVDNLFHIFPEISNFARRPNELFKTFCDFCMESGIPAAAVLMSPRTDCRKCKKALQIDQNWKPIVMYHLTRGTYLGCRISKKCSNCKIYEHYGFYTENGNRTFDIDCLSNEFLMSTDETAIDMMLLRYLNEDVIQGAVPFLLKSKVYNTVHGYSDTAKEKPSDEPTCQEEVLFLVFVIFAPGNLAGV